ncbi:GGDEF domain-containing protein [Alkalimonas delamerensis]|uniref:GGDEF domain-containing protein n=1 Tax=Alkalimonas delamerensis TaxID=265981 RepID=A0ABT9GRQ3_9GAMM|nr:GGDEF domain-containing protein [Alkalimonas delamerensis]MDP4529569.1 GGDEF domain-containing protein [Alkalimonas delamerensis]
MLRILEHKLLAPLFQPIITLQSGDVLGYEALIRGPSDSPLHSPLLLFKTAQAFSLLEELELLCRELSIRAFAVEAFSGLLFLNVNPLVLLASDHPTGMTKQLIAQAGLKPDQVVIELSEQFQVEDTELFVNAVKHYRDCGFKIAIDDLGSGFSGLKLWSELQPDIVKIDRYFIDQLHRDPIKKAFVRNIIELAGNTQSLIIAEGIETSEELLTCRELGADFGQGYLLGRPYPTCQIDPIHLTQLLNIDTEIALSDSLESILCKTPAFAEHTPAWEVADFFAFDKQLSCAAIINRQNEPIGIVTRSLIQEKFSHKFGHALYERKSISHCMEKSPVVVEKHLSIDHVSAILSDDENDDANQFFIVTEQGKYYGLGSVRKVLKRISENKIQLARYANPLTLLPGNVPINAHIEKLLKCELDFTIAYLDIDHFKPFNDHYGYSKGDLVIELLAQIIQTEVKSPHDFIGHIGGDDFIVVFHGTDAYQTSGRILSTFEQRVRHYYQPEDLSQGGFTATDRLGAETFYPILTLSIGIATPNIAACRNHHDVADLATAAKQQAKKISGSAIFVNKRQLPETVQVKATQLRHQP